MIKLIEILNQEIKVKDKELKDHGSDHSIFDFYKDSNKIIKYNRESRIGNEYKLFNKYPDIFVKIYKISSKYIIMEKVDAKGFERDSEKTSRELMGVEDEYIKKIMNLHFDLPGAYYSSLRSNNNRFINYIDRLKHKNEFIAKLTKVITKLVLITNGQNLDIHSGQFGYDIDDNIKIFDI